jgi:hypothetical protein
MRSISCVKYRPSIHRPSSVFWVWGILLIVIVIVIASDSDSDSFPVSISMSTVVPRLFLNGFEPQGYARLYFSSLNEMSASSIRFY